MKKERMLEILEKAKKIGELSLDFKIEKENFYNAALKAWNEDDVERFWLMFGFYCSTLKKPKDKTRWPNLGPDFEDSYKIAKEVLEKRCIKLRKELLSGKWKIDLYKELGDE